MTRHSQSRFDLVESILFSSYDTHLEGGGLVPQSRWWASCSRTGAQAGPLVAFCNTHTSPILLPLTPTSLSHTLSPSHHSNNIEILPYFGYIYSTTHPQISFVNIASFKLPETVVFPPPLLQRLCSQWHWLTCPLFLFIQYCLPISEYR